MSYISVYSDRTAFSAHMKVHSSVLVVIYKYIENNMQKHMLVVQRFGQLGGLFLARMQYWHIGNTVYLHTTHTPRINFVRQSNTVNNEWAQVHSGLRIMQAGFIDYQPKAVQSLYVEIYRIALKQPLTADCITIWSVIECPSYYLVNVLHAIRLLCNSCTLFSGQMLRVSTKSCTLQGFRHQKMYTSSVLVRCFQKHPCNNM